MATQTDENFVNLIYELNNTLTKNNIIIAYEGEINQMITKALAAFAEKDEMVGDDVTLKRRLYHVMVECMQNVYRHADDQSTGVYDGHGNGLLMITKDYDGYSVTTGNAINNDKIAELTVMLDLVNNSSKEEIKELFKKKILESRISEKGGAGLGFIDIAKKTGSKFFYHFKPLNYLTSFFILRVKVTKTI